MPTVRRSRTLRATPDEIWAIVGDAYHLPRWWPRVTRVEGVEDDAFTQVLTTGNGVPVRADFRVVESVRPAVRRWEQQLVNTPFERVLVACAVEVRLEGAGESGGDAGGDGGATTRVAITLAQRLRGLGLLGGFMVRRAGRRQLDGALDRLEALVLRPG
ncbi:MAG TPA: SRPBCC family protein [Solirubrobacteraceae bacterium]